MIDSRRKLLTEALGEKWHNIKVIDGIRHCSCGIIGNGASLYCINRTFVTADDYEALREKVIKENVSEFIDHLISLHYGTVEAVLRWWLTLSPEERNELICDFGIACLGWRVKE